MVDFEIVESPSASEPGVIFSSNPELYWMDPLRAIWRTALEDGKWKPRSWPTGWPP